MGAARGSSLSSFELRPHMTPLSLSFQELDLTNSRCFEKRDPRSDDICRHKSPVTPWTKRHYATRQDTEHERLLLNQTLSDEGNALTPGNKLIRGEIRPALGSVVVRRDSNVSFTTVRPDEQHY